jgi:hypothetical protein
MSVTFILTHKKINDDLCWGIASAQMGLAKTIGIKKERTGWRALLF